MSDTVKEANKNKHRYVSKIEYVCSIKVTYECANCGAEFSKKYQELEFLDTPICYGCLADFKIKQMEGDDE